MDFIHKNDIFLGLDIGASSVKALIARNLPNNTIEILGTGLAEQSPSALKNGAIVDIPAVTSACEKAILSAEKESSCKASQTVVGLAGELVKTNTSTVHYRRESEDKPLSESEMEVIFDKVKSMAELKAKKEIAFEADNREISISLINSTIISIIIDGQKVNNPIGFKGSDVTLEIYTAFAPKSYITPIEKLCSDLELELSALAVEPYATCRACLGNGDSLAAPMIVLDIGSSNTNISVIDNIGIRGTSTFAMGSATIERNLPIWSSGVEIALSEFDALDILPSRIFLCGGTSASLELQEHLALSDWYKNLPFARRPLINLLDASELPALINKSKSFNSSFIVALGLARIGTDSSAQSKGLITTKIKKLLQK